MIGSNSHRPEEGRAPFEPSCGSDEYLPLEDTINQAGDTHTRQHKIVRWIAIRLMLVLVLLFFVPMPGNAEDGNALFRLVIVGMSGIAILGVIERPLMTANLIKRSWPLWILFAWLLLTSLWAPYPDLSVRRGFAYVLMGVIAVSLAVSFDRPADFHRPLFQALAAVFMVNMVSAHTVAPIDAGMGVNGIYAQKNGAGALALYVILVASSAVLLYKWRLTKLLSLALAVLGWTFLVSTRAKTSIATAGLLTIGLPALASLLSRSAPYKVLVATGLAVLVGAALFTQYLLGVTGEQIGEAVFGDLTFTNRTFIWNALQSDIALHPWTGSGFGSFWGTGQVLNPITGARPDAFFMAPDVINEAHNGYIDITLQAGYVGLGLTALVILRSVWGLTSVISIPDAAKEDRIVCAMLLGLVFALAVSNFTESELFSPSNPIGYLFVVVVVQAERWRSLNGSAAASIAGDAGRDRGGHRGESAYQAP